MNVTRDVIIDLWPLYESGEASEDTRRLIEEFLNSDQKFAKLIHNSAEQSLRTGALPPLHREREVETLRKTKRLLRLRDYVLCVAVLLTFNPLVIYHATSGDAWVLDHPSLVSGLALAVVIAWSFYFVLKRRLRATGL